MMDQSSINILGIIPTQLKKVANTNGGEHAGPCPFCGGKNRFRVWSEQGRVWCRQCEFSGDAIAFVMKYHSKDFKEAVEFLRLELPKQENNQRKTTKKANPPISPGVLKDDYACFTYEWQRHCDHFITESIEHLSNHPGAMDYLYKRGLTKAVIWASELGFNPAPKWITWGDIKYKVPRGIVIPWMFDGMYWRVRFRCLDDNYQAFTPTYNGHEQKYPQIKGSANGMYFGGRSSRITTKTTVVLVESEFDALAVTSNAPKLLPYGLLAVATGGSQNAKLMKWITRLSIARRVYLAFDADQAGATASLWWRQALSNGYRLRPTQKDVTDMVTAGDSLYQWLGYTHQPNQLKMFDVPKKKDFKYA